MPPAHAETFAGMAKGAKFYCSPGPIAMKYRAFFGAALRMHIRVKEPCKCLFFQSMAARLYCA
jgi:hypothetical protein